MVWSSVQGNEAAANTIHVKLIATGNNVTPHHAVREFIEKIEQPATKPRGGDKLLLSKAASRMKGVGAADPRDMFSAHHLTSALRDCMLSLKDQPEFLQAKTIETCRLWGIDYDSSDLHNLHVLPHATGSLRSRPCNSSHAAAVCGTEAQHWNMCTDIGLVACNATIPNSAPPTAALPNAAIPNAALPAGYGKGLTDCGQQACEGLPLFHEGLVDGDISARGVQTSKDMDPCSKVMNAFGHQSSRSVMSAVHGGGRHSNDVVTIDPRRNLLSAFCGNDFTEMLRMLDGSEAEAAPGDAGSAALHQDIMKHQRPGIFRALEISGWQDSDADTSDELLGELPVMNSDLLEMACDMLEMNSDLPMMKSDLLEMACGLLEMKSDLPMMKSDLLEMACSLLEMKSDLPMMKSDLPMMKSDLLEMKSDLPMMMSDLLEMKSDLSFMTSDLPMMKSGLPEMKCEHLELKSDLLGMQSDLPVLNIDLLEMKSDLLEMKSDLPVIMSDLLERPSYWPALNAPLLITGLRLDADNAAYIDASTAINTAANTDSTPAASMAAASFSAPLMKLQTLVRCDGGENGSADESPSMLFQKRKRKLAASDDLVDPFLSLDHSLSTPHAHLMAAQVRPQRAIQSSGSDAFTGATLHGQDGEPGAGMRRVLSSSVADVREMNRTAPGWDPHTSAKTNLGASTNRSHSAPLPFVEARTKSAGTRLKRMPMQSAMDMDTRSPKIDPLRHDSVSSVISEAMHPRALKDEEEVGPHWTCYLRQTTMGASEICKRSKKGSPITKAILRGLYHISTSDAAAQLGIGSTAMKDLCRRYKIDRWPYRKLNSLDGLIATLEEAETQTPRELLDRVLSVKAAMMEDPNTIIPEDVKGLRQANFKIRYKDRKAGGN